jgi:hypothetical protein
MGGTCRHCGDHRVFCSASAALQMSRQASPLQNGPVQAHYRRLPLTLEANKGQTSSQVRFPSRGKGYAAFLTAGGIVLSLPPNQPVPVQQTSDDAPPNQSQQVLNTTPQFKIQRAAQNAAVVGEGPQPGKVSYFNGQDLTKWHTNVLTYARVHYKNLFPGRT